jgi:hypothetical protein
MNFGTKQFWQTFLGLSAALAALAIYQTEQQTQALLKIQSRYKWVILIGIFAINLIAGIFLLALAGRRDIFGFLERGWAMGAGWRAAGLALLLAGFGAVWFVRLDFFGQALTALFPIFWVVWWASLFQAAGLRLLLRSSWAAGFALALLAQGVGFQAYAVLQGVTDYPFTITWSEASRYYYGSLIFSKLVYGRQLPLSIWHPSRYILLSIPFLLTGLPLWAHRLWQALLWLGLTGLSSWLLVRRLRLKVWTSALLLGGWFFLYLFQGAVYYHLQVCVILILLGVSMDHPRRSIFAVLLASFWAGMSRLNWFPVPAMLAATLYFLEQPLQSPADWRVYLRKPALWGLLGLAAALLGETFYILWSGNQDISGFGSSLSSPLLWYRLLPNPTNPLGILPGIALVSLPLVLILRQIPRGRIHPLRSLAAAGILAALFVGGAIVSTKIGGGGDLHNMDAFILLLGVIAGYGLSGRIVDEGGSPIPVSTPWPLVAFLLIVPVGFALTRFTPRVSYNREQAAAELAALQQAVQSAGASGEVLFIYERHLLTFGLIREVPLVPDYEVITLQEMAISGNQAYLQAFYDDLGKHRFTAIVAHRQSLDAASTDFAEESALWNQRVLYPLLCEYEPALTLELSNVWVLVPRASRECPAFESNPELP